MDSLNSSWDTSGDLNKVTSELQAILTGVPFQRQDDQRETLEINFIYLEVKDFLPLRLKVVPDTGCSPGQRDPAYEQSSEHHIRERCCERSLVSTALKVSHGILRGLETASLPQPRLCRMMCLIMVNYITYMVEPESRLEKFDFVFTVAETIYVARNDFSFIWRVSR